MSNGGPIAGAMDMGPDLTGSDGGRARSTIAGQIHRLPAFRRWTLYRKSRAWEKGGARDRASVLVELERFPENEHIEVAALWLVELYTPSAVRGLLMAIEKNGWDRGMVRDRSLTDWMGKVREGRLAGWTSIGPIGRPRAPRIFSEVVSDLPEGVQFVLPRLMSLTPSVTALVACFVLDAPVSDAVMGPLTEDFHDSIHGDPRRKWYRTLRYLAFGGTAHNGYSVIPPHVRRARAVEETLDDIETQCAAWIRANLPGTFARGLRQGSFPSFALLVTEQMQPLTEPVRHLLALEGTRLNRDLDAWADPGLPQFRFVFPRAWERRPLRVHIGCKRSEAVPEGPGRTDRASHFAIAHHLDESLHGFASRWAQGALLDGYHEVLATQRDRAGSPGPRRPIRELKAVRELVRTDALDMFAAAGDISSLTEDLLAFTYDVLEPQRLRQPGGEPINFLNNLREAQRERSRQLTQSLQLLLTTLSTSADLAQTISNTRTQRLVTVLTAVSLVLAGVAVAIALREPALSATSPTDVLGPPAVAPQATGPDPS